MKIETLRVLHKRIDQSFYWVIVSLFVYCFGVLVWMTYWGFTSMFKGVKITTFETLVYIFCGMVGMLCVLSVLSWVVFKVIQKKEKTN